MQVKEVFPIAILYECWAWNSCFFRQINLSGQKWIKIFVKLTWSGQKWDLGVSFLPAKLRQSGQKWILGVSFLPAPQIFRQIKWHQFDEFFSYSKSIGNKIAEVGSIRNGFSSLWTEYISSQGRRLENPFLISPPFSNHIFSWKQSNIHIHAKNRHRSWFYSHCKLDFTENFVIFTLPYCCLIIRNK